MPALPDDRRYNVRDPKTGLVHQAMAFDEEAYGAALTMHATWCSIEVSRDWALADDEPLSCFSCLSEAATTFRTYMKPGIGIINTASLSKLKFPDDT